MSLRLQKLPDRTRVRMNVSIDPDLACKLNDYAEIYGHIYGSPEKPKL